jgi:hypothetical protein
MFYIFIFLCIGSLFIFLKNDLKNSTAKDLLQFGITISGAFVGLYTTFLLNTQKLNSDKKDHLISILKSVQKKQKTFIWHLKAPDHLVLNTSKIFSTRSLIQSIEFPYLTEVKDPVIYDMSGYSQVEISLQEENLKQVFDQIKTDTSNIKDRIIALKFFSWVDSSQIDIEIQHLSQTIDDSTLHKMSNDLVDSSRARFERGWIPPSAY